MSSFLSFLPVDGWQRLMCDALWQSTLIAGLGWIVARFLVRQSAARAWLLLMSLMACVLVPLASMAARDFGWTVLPLASDLDSRPSAGSVASPSIDFAKYAELASARDAEPDTSVMSWSPDHDTQPTAGLPAAFSAPGDLRSVESAGSGDPRTTQSTGLILLQILGGIWMAMGLFLAIRLALGFVAMRRIVRSAVACDDAELLTSATEAARRIGVPCPPVSYSRHVETPTIFAFGRSRLLVPPVEASLRGANTVALPTAAIAAPDAAGNISRLRHGESAIGETRPPIDWIVAFSHELAHVARGDGWSRLAVECIRIALPLQPLIWLLRRSFHTACEEACDDWAVATGSSPVDLADTLTAWINRPRLNSSLPAIGMSSTKSRTMRLLAIQTAPVARLGGTLRWAIAAATTLLIGCFALAQTPPDQAPYKDDTSLSESAITELREVSDTSEMRNTSDKRAFTSTKTANRSTLKLGAGGKIQLELLLDSSQIVALDRDIPRAQVNNREIVELTAVSPNQIVVFAKREGATQISLFDREGQVYVVDCVIKKEEPIVATPSRGARRATLPPYIIEPPDILLLTPIRLVPHDPTRIQPLESVFINVDSTNFPISGKFKVDSSGEVVLGPRYGSVKISGKTRREAQDAVKNKLLEVLKDPEVALTLDESRVEKQIEGQHLVGPDGTINLGTYGQVLVDGDTIAEARKAVQDKLSATFIDPEIAVDIFAYNSKVYYVISKGAGFGDNIQRFPVTGNETVLDALAQINATATAKTKIWIARPNPQGVDKILNVDWEKISQGGGESTNYQVLPSDRIYIDNPEIGKAAKKSQSQGKALPNTSNF